MTRSRKYRLSSFGVLRSTSRPTSAERSRSIRTIHSPTVSPGSNSTSTSTSLSGPKSGRNADPNTLNRRIRLASHSLFRPSCGNSIRLRIAATLDTVKTLHNRHSVAGVDDGFRHQSTRPARTSIHLRGGQSQYPSCSASQLQRASIPPQRHKGHKGTRHPLDVLCVLRAFVANDLGAHIDALPRAVAILRTFARAVIVTAHGVELDETEQLAKADIPVLVIVVAGVGSTA